MHLKRILIVAAVLATAGITACSGPEPIRNTQQGSVALEGNTVVWTTDDAALAAVRYGRRSGQYDRVAYPAASLRADKSFTSDHRVPLLDVNAGETVFLQLLNRVDDGRFTASEEYEFTVLSRQPKRPVLEWTMIDVGFGDSHYIETPGGETGILIDAGERRDWENVDAFLRSRGVSRLDYLIGTHIHADHIGGMVGSSSLPGDGVAAAYDIGVFLDSPQKSESRFAYDELLGILNERGIPIRIVAAGETNETNPDLAWDPQIRVEALNAGFGTSIGGTSEGDRLNNDSFVFRLTYGEVNFMLGGDAEGPVETKLIGDHGSSLEGEVLKIHHHGVNDASQTSFLTTVNPRVGLIPIATFESFSGSLPSSSVLDRMENNDIDIFASDRAEPLGIVLSGDNGHNVSVITDGISYEILVVPSQSVHESGNDSPRPPAFDPEEEVQ